VSIFVLEVRSTLTVAAGLVGRNATVALPAAHEPISRVAQGFFDREDVPGAVRPEFAIRRQYRHACRPPAIHAR